MDTTKKTWTMVLAGLGIGIALPRCNCDEGPGIQRAAVEMELTYVEEEPCSGAQIPRRIPDDFMGGLSASTDFGSIGVRRFEVRSVGIAPLNVKEVRIVNRDANGAEIEADPEFTLSLTDAEENEVTLPQLIAASAEATTPPGLVITVNYGSQDDLSDLVELVVVSDDPDRENVTFALSAGRGRIEVCGNTGCGDDAGIMFSNVSIDGEAEEILEIKNVGEGDLDLRSIRLESDSLEFCAFEATEIPDGVEECAPIRQCLVIPPNGTYTVRVRYRPIDGGQDRGSIHIASGDASAGTIVVPINGVGAGPGVCICVVDGANCNDASFVDFGLANVNEGTSRAIRLVSCGTEPVDITEAMLEMNAGNPFVTGPEFAITRPFATGTINPGEFSEGEITYTPTSGGTHTGGLRYNVASSSLNAWVRLLGAASTCDMEVLPTMVNFGTVAGGAIGNRDVILVNNGARDCTLVNMTAPDNSFSIPNPPAIGTIIPPGGSEAVQVQFAPPVGPVSQYMSSFDVTSDEPGPNATTTVNLQSEGGGTPLCNVRVTPSGNDIGITMRDGRLQFGAVNIGYSTTLPIRIQNVGNADCTIQSFNLTTEAMGEFTIAPDMPVPGTIPPAGVLNLNVTFAPTREASNPFGLYGGFFNYVSFSLNGPGITQTDWEISLSASPTRPTIDVIPGNVDFGVVTWERPQAPDNRSSCGSTTRAVNVYNSGNGSLILTSVAIDATSDPVFLVTNVIQNGSTLTAPYANITIPPGGNVTVELRFFPSRVSPAPHNGLLIIDNDVTNPGGMGAPLSVPLRGEGTINSQQTDVFQQVQDNQIDILWVLDDSGSMSEEQNLLANNFASFIGYADGLIPPVDYQVAVTTTEVNDAVSGNIWACNGFNKILRPSDPNRVAAFQCAANVTNPPNGNSRPNPGGSDEQEAGLQAARIALDVPVVNVENMGFLRPDARLAVIIVSDEEDQSDGTTNLYIDFFRNLKGFANPQLVSVSAIAGDVPGGCATAVAGQRYSTAASALNGQFESICSNSWATLLQNIGLNVFTLRRAWTLSRPADPTSIVVRVNGVVVSQNGSNGWVFDPATNTITFAGTAIPAPGATVEVQYGTQCLP